MPSRRMKDCGKCKCSETVIEYRDCCQVAQSGVLLELDKATLLEALTSDFLQAAELDVLQATLRWGEHQLLRRMEDRGEALSHFIGLPHLNCTDLPIITICRI